MANRTGEFGLFWLAGEGRVLAGKPRRIGILDSSNLTITQYLFYQNRSNYDHVGAPLEIARPQHIAMTDATQENACLKSPPHIACQDAFAATHRRT
jgi:hypothetical protein